MAGIAFGLASSLLWGLADYLGGLKSRSFPVPVVLAVMYVSSLAVMLSFVAARGEGMPASEHVLAALGAGLVGIAGLAAFYRALAIGTMSIVAPIAATGVSLPVIVGLIGGDDPGPVRATGLALAVVGIVVASREDDGGAADARQQRLSVLLAIVAGIGFGSYFVLAEVGSSGDVAWTLVLSRVVALPLLAAIALVALRRGAARPVGPTLAALAAIGLLDLGATAAYNHASTIGELSSVAVASSLYPVTTVMLAALLLGERVRGVQRIGVVVALAGVLLIAAGA
ncbi:MAG TPA: DMT family transporter [Solirubrobacteraceae bacterium]|nr:DMT family transporter [Solirubrobacteraceae bacterium]